MSPVISFQVLYETTVHYSNDISLLYGIPECVSLNDTLFIQLTDFSMIKLGKISKKILVQTAKKATIVLPIFSNLCLRKLKSPRISYQ